MRRKWTVRRYEEADEQGVCELWKAVYPERVYENLDWLEWRAWDLEEESSGGGLDVVCRR